MRYPQGGTQIYCPNCKTVTVCKAVTPSSAGYDSGQRFHKTTHLDVSWFRRIRICKECEEDFPTAELDERFVDELVELRDALAEIKQSAEAYIRQSNSASKSLTKLSKSLGVLRALPVYKDA